MIETSVGVDRTMLMLLCEAYYEDKMNEEKRTVMRFLPRMAPVKVAVFPLLKNKPQLIKNALEVYALLKKHFLSFGLVKFDDNGNIGKRYRRQDEIGTPWCVTIDFDTLKDNTVTVRDRDTGEQIRKPTAELAEYFENMLK